jgi:DNA-binding transcriptional ArsR family regulator
MTTEPIEEATAAPDEVAETPAAVLTELDPMIHVPARLRLMATLAALGDGDSLSFTRLQDMIGLTPGNLITHLRKLEEVGYVISTKTVIKLVPQTSVGLTHRGRAALDSYREALRELLGGL